jgi:SAM-dependent methyltransferase
MIKSPITHTTNVAHIQDLDTNTVIEKYRKEFSIDVRNELEGFPVIGVYQCKDSLLKFYGDYDKIAGGDRFYCQLSENYKGYYSEDKWEFNAVMPYFKTTDRVLEIGSGGGYFLQKLRNRGITDLTGLEISTDAVAACRTKGFHVVQSPIEQFASTPVEPFDVICSFQIFEHLPNVDSTIRKSIEVLKEGGTMIISVPNNDSVIFSKDPYHTLNLPPHHVMLWDEASLRKIADIYNLELVDIHKSVASSIEKSWIYKLQLMAMFGAQAGSLIHVLTRFLAKRIMGRKDGSTIIGVYRKQKN